MKYYPTTEKIKVTNYPYGYTLKTDKYYSIEFKKGKGHRLIEQTLNPKTGLLNKPKKSVYYPLMLLTMDDNGHVKTHVEDFYDDKGKDKGYKFIFDNFDKFTPDEIEYYALHNIMLLKADIYAKATYCGSDVKALLPLYKNAMETLVQIAKTKINLWNQVNIDWQAVKSLEIPGFSPFKITTLA